MSFSKRDRQAAGFISEQLQQYIDRILAERRMSRGEEIELMSRWCEHGDEAASRRIVEAHMRFVVAIALGYRSYPVSMDDLISEGSLGLVVALGKFDPSRGTRFVTYSSFWIRACILDFIIRTFHSGKQGTGPFTSKLFFKLRRERARLFSKYGDGKEGMRELSRRIGLRESVLEEMLHQLDSGDVSLDQPLLGRQDATMRDMLEDTRVLPDEEASEAECSRLLGQMIDAAMEQLDDRERFVIRERMLVGSRSTLAEVGRSLGVSRERARQLEERARRKLRTELADAYAVIAAA
jgi:RNA polymerase sigma-32 factor